MSFAILPLAMLAMACGAASKTPKSNTRSTVAAAPRARCQHDRLEGKEAAPIAIPFGAMSTLLAGLTICPSADIDTFDFNVYFSGVLEVSVWSDVELLLTITEVSKSPNVEIGHGYDIQDIRTGAASLRRKVDPGQYRVTLMVAGSKSASYSLAVAIGKPSVGD